MVVSIAKIFAEKLSNLTEEDMEKVRKGIEELSKSPFIEDLGITKSSDLLKEWEEYQRQNGKNS
jgi:DNA-binding transcriptional regulator YiaG